MLFVVPKGMLRAIFQLLTSVVVQNIVHPASADTSAACLWYLGSEGNSTDSVVAADALCQKPVMQEIKLSSMQN